MSPPARTTPAAEERELVGRIRAGDRVAFAALVHRLGGSLPLQGPRGAGEAHVGSGTPMLTCREIVELVTAYAEGQLRPMDRMRFLLHIGMCRNCRTYVRQVKATTKALAKLPPPELSPELETELLRCFETWKSSR